MLKRLDTECRSGTDHEGPAVGFRLGAAHDLGGGAPREERLPAPLGVDLG